MYAFVGEVDAHRCIKLFKSFDNFIIAIVLRQLGVRGLLANVWYFEGLDDGLRGVSRELRPYLFLLFNTVSDLLSSEEFVIGVEATVLFCSPTSRRYESELRNSCDFCLLRA